MSRIELRRVRSGDAADLIAANQANQHYHRPWVASLTDQAGFDAWFARTPPDRTYCSRARTRRAAWLAWSTSTRSSPALFSAPISAITACPEFRGSGMMGEALRATVELAFGELGLHRLEANVQPPIRHPSRCCGAPGSARKGFRRAICGLTGSGATTSVGPCWPTTLRQLAQKGWPAGTGRRSAFARRQPTAARRRMKSSSSAAKPAGSSRLGRWPAPTNRALRRRGSSAPHGASVPAHAENPGRPRPPASARRRPPGADRRGRAPAPVRQGRSAMPFMSRNKVRVSPVTRPSAASTPSSSWRALQRLTRSISPAASAWRSSSICACTGGS